MVSSGVLDVDDVVGTLVALNVLEHADTTNIVSALNVNLSAILEFNHLVDVSSLQVKLDQRRTRIKYIIDF